MRLDFARRWRGVAFAVLVGALLAPGGSQSAIGRSARGAAFTLHVSVKPEQGPATKSVGAGLSVGLGARLTARLDAPLRAGWKVVISGRRVAPSAAVKSYTCTALKPGRLCEAVSSSSVPAEWYFVAELRDRSHAVRRRSNRVHVVWTGAPKATWTGTWDTNYGEMKLTQSGSTVTGTYTTACTVKDGGSITGRITGRDLTGTWKQGNTCNPADSEGTISFTLIGKRFSGPWRSTRVAGSEGTWTGTCISGACLRNS